MSDNTTAHAANDYETEVKKTIPLHDEIVRTAIDVVLTALPRTPRSSRGPQAGLRWLDTGCGPGKLGALALESAPETELWLADPSAAMLAIARTRNAALSAERFIQKPSEDLPPVEVFGGPFDAITAVLSHHYGDAPARERSVARCRDLLAPGGVLVVFENVRAESDAAHELQRQRWAAFQRRMGRDEDTIKKALDREGTAFFPIRVSEHLALFARLGLAAELVFRSYGQAGFYCRK